MKKILLILCLIPILISAQSDFRILVQNKSGIDSVDGRSVLFGLKEKSEEMLIEKGWILTDTFNPNLDVDRDGEVKEITIVINQIESPHQVINIIGTKWLKKEYIVTMTVEIPGDAPIYLIGKGRRTNFLFAMFLDVEGNEVPLNRKSLSKALESSLRICLDEI